MFVPNFMKIERGPVFFLLIWYGMTQKTEIQNVFAKLSYKYLFNCAILGPFSIEINYTYSEEF